MHHIPHATGKSPISRRGIARALAASLVLLASPVVSAAQRQESQKKFKIITRTFTSTTPIAIVDSSISTPYPSTIKVSGFKQGKLLDVNVTLKNLSHGDPSDINLLLQAPGGRRAIIMSDAGEDFGVTGLTIKLDDQAATGLPFTLPLSSGTFKPTNFGPLGSDEFPPPAPAGDIADIALSTFKGINPNGTWRLFVVDDVDVGTGSIGAWSLTIKARVRT